MAEKIEKCKISEGASQNEDNILCNDEEEAFERTEDSKKKKNRRKKQKPSAEDNVLV